MSDHFADPPSSGPPASTPIPNGPVTPAPSPVYGPAPRHYGEPPPPTYSPRPTTQPVPVTEGWAPPLGAPPAIAPVADPPRHFGSPADGGASEAVRSDCARWAGRVLGYLIDFAPALLGALALIVAYVLLLVALARAPVDAQLAPPDLGPVLGWGVIGAVLVLTGLAWEVYNRWLIGGRTGRSLGKRVMKLRLISEQTGEPIGPLNAFARDLIHILDGMACVGYLWPLWDEKRQTFADMLMHTVVVDERTQGQGRAS